MQEEEKMSEDKRVTRTQAHQAFASETNNATWDMIEKSELTPEEEIEMIHQVHASCFHWSKVGEPVHMVRGHYMVAKVYFALDMKESARYWAEKAFSQAKELGLTSWDYAFVCEIMARAHGAAGDREAFAKLHKEAEKTIAELDTGDAALCRGELDRGPWYGMK
jgi:hypothetical protein